MRRPRCRFCGTPLPLRAQWLYALAGFGIGMTVAVVILLSRLTALSVDLARALRVLEGGCL